MTPIGQEHIMNIMSLCPSIAPYIYKAVTTTPRREVSFPLELGVQGVHEVCERHFGDMAAITGFVLAAAKTKPGAIAWILQQSVIFDHGNLLTAGQFAITRFKSPILRINTGKQVDTLWAIEEAIKSGAVSCVIAELTEADFTASRRLALASGRHGVPVILLMPYTRQGSTAASARWRVSARPSAPNQFDRRAPGAVRWQAILERSRIAPHMAGHVFNIELDDETLSLRVVAGLAADTVAACAAGAESGHDAAPGQPVRRYAG